MFYCEVPKDSFIFKQGDKASSYFIVNEGSMEVIINEQVKKVIKPGEGFGDLALLFNAERSASIRACQNCGLWGIDRTTFRKVVEEMVSKQYKENRKFMEKIKFFRDIFFLDRMLIIFLRKSHRTTKGFNSDSIYTTKI